MYIIENADGIKFLDTTIELGKFTVDPTNISKGTLYFNSSENKVKFSDGTSYVNLSPYIANETLKGSNGVQIQANSTADISEQTLTAGYTFFKHDITQAGRLAEGDVKFFDLRVDDAATLTVFESGLVNYGSDLIGQFTDNSLVSKKYVDNLAKTLDTKESVNLTTATALPQNTAAGSRIGKTLTGDVNAALSVDGVTVLQGWRILVKNEASKENNGIYDVTQVGDDSNPWILTRSDDADEDTEVTNGLFTFTEQGTSNQSTGWRLQTADPITVDTTELDFTQFSGVGTGDWNSNGTFSGASNIEVLNSATADISQQTSTAGFTFLDVDIADESRSANGDVNFINFKNDKVSKFSVDINGDTNANSFITPTSNSDNWETAFGWGDHSTVGYLTDLSAQTTDDLVEGDINEYSKWEIGSSNDYNLKVPTRTEWEAERDTWSTADAAGAFASVLKLTRTGIRTSSIGNVGNNGYYWSATVNEASTNNSQSFSLFFHTSSANIAQGDKSFGEAIRLIVDGTFTQNQFDENYLNEIIAIDGINYGFVYNPTTERIWLDRNLGATQVAISSTDSNSYGDLYQWGRQTDGHEKRNSNTTSIQATTPQPEHGDFIVGFDNWLTPNDDTLWQGVGAVNDLGINEKLIGKNNLKASYSDLLNTLKFNNGLVNNAGTVGLGGELIDTGSLIDIYFQNQASSNFTPRMLIQDESGNSSQILQNKSSVKLRQDSGASGSSISVSQNKVYLSVNQFDNQIILDPINGLEANLGSIANSKGIYYLGFGETDISTPGTVDYSGLAFNSLVPKKYVDDGIALHADLTNNPHSVTADQVGLDNVDNTSDLNKPISTATQDALDLKLDASLENTFANGLTETSNEVTLGGTVTDRIRLQNSALDFDMNYIDFGLDTVFTTNIGTGFSGSDLFNDVQVIKIDSQNNIIAGGSFETFNNTNTNQIAKLNFDGTLNSTFTTNIGTGFDSQLSDILIDDNDKYLNVGYFTSFNGTTSNRIVRLNSDGTLDTAFTTNIGTGFSNSTASIDITSDGKFIVVGNFTSFNGTTSNRIVRLNSDGTLDTAFTTNIGSGFDNKCNIVKVQNDGKIIVGGNFTSFNGTASNRIVRLNSDGTLDTAFTTNIGTGFDNRIESLHIQTDDKILIGGVFTSFNGTTSNSIVRLNFDGTLDTVFTTNIGSGSDNFVNSIKTLSDGQILLGGSFLTFNGITVNRLVKLQANGTIDNNFVTDTGTSFNEFVFSVLVLSDDSYLIGGRFTNFDNNPTNGIAKLLNASSSLLQNFTDVTLNVSNSVKYASDVSSQFTGLSLVHKNYVDNNIALHADLTNNPHSVTKDQVGLDNVDNTSDLNKPISTATQSALDLKLDASEDNTFANGLTETGNEVTLGGTVTDRIRLNNNLIDFDINSSEFGLNDSFTTNIGSGTDLFTRDISLQSDGKILIGGSFTEFNGISSNKIARLNSGGTLDTAFTTNIGTGFNEEVRGIKVLSNGKIIVVGLFSVFNGNTRNKIVCLNADGTEDTTFAANIGTGFDGNALTLQIQSDDKILVGGAFNTFNGTTTNEIARLNSDGTLDTTFTTNIGTGFNSTVWKIYIEESDSKILVGGAFTSFDGNSSSKLARLNSDGTLDVNFSTNIGIGFNSNVFALSIDSNNKILVGGSFTSFNNNIRNRILRLNSDGTEDVTFATNIGTGFDNTLFYILNQLDNKILICGQFTSFNGTSINRIIRLNEDGTENIKFTTNAGIAFNNSLFVLNERVKSKYLIGGSFQSFNSISTNGIAFLQDDISSNYQKFEDYFLDVINSVKYASDVSSQFTGLSLVHKDYVDTEISKINSLDNSFISLSSNQNIDLGTEEYTQNKVIKRTYDGNVTNLSFSNGVEGVTYKVYIQVDSTGGYDFEYNYSQMRTQDAIPLIIPTDPNSLHLLQVELMFDGKYLIYPIYNIEDLTRSFDIFSGTGTETTTATGNISTDTTIITSETGTETAVVTGNNSTITSVYNETSGTGTETTLATGNISTTSIV